MNSVILSDRSEAEGVEGPAFRNARTTNAPAIMPLAIGSPL
jgi:hypothetical protein